jgi:hypothetical protein
MKFIPSKLRTLSRAVLALGCVVSLGACTMWAEVARPMPADHREFTIPVQLTRYDGYSVVLEHAVIAGDSIIGDRQGTVSHRMAVPLSDVQTMRRQEVDPAKSLGLLALSAAAAFGGYVYLLFNAD